MKGYHACRIAVVMGIILAVCACRDSALSAPPSGGQKAPVAGAPPEEPGFAASWDRHNFDHSLWGRVLGRWVDARGLVAYHAIARDREYKEYLYRLSRTDAAALANDHQRLAFWINAYNALTIRAVLDTLPPDRAQWPDYRIKDRKVGGKSIWKGAVFTVGGGQWTLDGIEHDILRKRDGLRDPRIHVALVCAARGCPALWNRAYDPAQIDKQLDAAMQRFVGDARQCRIEPSKRLITLSKVFKWYASDFTNRRFKPHADSIPAFLARYARKPGTARALADGKWKIEYNKYDWRLNLQAPHLE